MLALQNAPAHTPLPTYPPTTTTDAFLQRLQKFLSSHHGGPATKAFSEDGVLKVPSLSGETIDLLYLFSAVRTVNGGFDKVTDGGQWPSVTKQYLEKSTALVSTAATPEHSACTHTHTNTSLSAHPPTKQTHTRPNRTSRRTELRSRRRPEC